MKKFIIFAIVLIVMSAIYLLAQSEFLNSKIASSNKTPADARNPAQSTTESNLTKMVEVIKSEKRMYLDLSLNEQRDFIAAKVFELSVMKESSNFKAPDAALAKIKVFVDAYAKRLNTKRLNDCRFGDNLQATYERAAKNAPMIIERFNREKVDPQIGLYLAMIESEHCACLQSPTGPIGLFQLSRATAEKFGLKVFEGASPNKPDDRCDPGMASTASAKQIKSLLASANIKSKNPLFAIVPINNGSSENVQSSDNVWQVIANGTDSTKKSRVENYKFISKFLGAAIIGENPQTFGLTLEPLSSYNN